MHLEKMPYIGTSDRSIAGDGATGGHSSQAMRRSLSVTSALLAVSQAYPHPQHCPSPKSTPIACKAYLYLSKIQMLDFKFFTGSNLN
ncbi:MAG: hypothetical protein KME31_03975 [Tolypothrix carrinoi HA7290-LM1]|nr:hypothetical protein [Tolypothrix carrinoi HA7290-LM1]